MNGGGAAGGEPPVWHDSLAAFAVHLRGLHERCQSAYHAFDELPQLVDQLRILSVNAELASARAGDYGRAVRVLTQFATESVTRLLSVVPQMIALKKQTYGMAGAVMRAVSEIRSLEAAGGRVLAAGHRFPAGEEDPLDNAAQPPARSCPLGGRDDARPQQPGGDRPVGAPRDDAGRDHRHQHRHRGDLGRSA